MLLLHLVLTLPEVESDHVSAILQIHWLQIHWFKSQCLKVHSMMNARLTQLCFIKKVIDKKTAISIYKTMILPVFDYADRAIDGGPTLAISRLQTVQNNCLRLCLGIKKNVTLVRLTCIFCVRPKNFNFVGKNMFLYLCFVDPRLLIM